ncbi:MAG: NEW3 domain-containing protein, partial [Armatimonadota bacterium]
LQYVRERLVEPGETVFMPAPSGAQQPLTLKLEDRTKPAVTLLAALLFRDAAGTAHTVQRRGYAYFGAISELTATYEPATNTIAARLRNADTSPRQFDLALSAPVGVQLSPTTTNLSLAAGESRAVPVKITFAADLKSGEYPVRVTAALPGGLVIDETQVNVQYVTPLQPGDLALSATGAQVAVDSVYYAYSEKPVNDGVVVPTGPFNEGAWAAAEAEQDHWVQLTWPTAQTIGRVQVYWNIEDGVTWTGRQVRVEARVGGQWVKMSELVPAGPAPVTTLLLTPVTTTALRLVQPKGMGPEKRPNIMWVRE